APAAGITLAIAAVAAAVAPAAGALGTRPGFIHRQGTPIQLLPVQGGDGGIHLVGIHIYEAEALAPPIVVVGQGSTGAADRTVRLLKLRFGGVEREVADEQSLA